MSLHRKAVLPNDMLEITDHTAPRRWRAATLWCAGTVGLGVALLLCFVSYGATVALAIGLTIFVIAYMLLMGRWASHHGDRRDF